jgi:hypothetical protein
VDWSHVGIDFVTGLPETCKIGRESGVGDSEWTLVGVIIGEQLPSVYVGCVLDVDLCTKIEENLRRPWRLIVSI